ncbi:MAG: 3-dehydroquinate synthase [Bacteroidales bacterium]|jgi:3-dehydroquinate synthase|nr:3-dehydroquinate synthase [Bacteroidales bacterium]
MKSIKINTAGGESVILMGGTVDDLRERLPAKGLYIITDTNVGRIYRDIFPKGEVLEIEAGEKSKTPQVVIDLCRRMLDAGADRSSFVLGFGGGVVCDIAGLTASLFMRGVRHAFVSTSLLSQIDASIGGKNGVNLGEYKNIIGTIRQPEFVLCDHNMLATLPEEEFLSGMGEMYKHAAIRDRNLFFDLSASADRIAARDPGILGDLILRSVRIKAAIVRRDPMENGIRRLLNFGHTFGHVLEIHYGMPHGVAVARGMVIAAELSAWTGEMPHAEYRLLSVEMEKAGLIREAELPPNVIGRIARDKKSEAGSVNFVLLRAVGKAIVRRLSLTDLQAFVNYYNERKDNSQSIQQGK